MSNIFESVGLEDKLVEIGSGQLKESIECYVKQGKINTISSMNNHLNANRAFFEYLFREGMVRNVFNDIPDYNLFRSEIIKENGLRYSIGRGYIETEWLDPLLKYLNGEQKNISIQYY